MEHNISNDAVVILLKKKNLPAWRGLNCVNPDCGRMLFQINRDIGTISIEGGMSPRIAEKYSPNTTMSKIKCHRCKKFYKIYFE